MLDFKLRELMECSKEERRSCLPLVDKIIELANLARMEGLLALEEHIPSFNEHLLKVGVTIMVDGVSREANQEIMDNIIISSGKTGADLIRQMIIRDGVLAIQAGESPRLIEIKIKAYFGEDLA